LQQSVSLTHEKEFTMKLVTFSYDDNAPRLGVVEGDSVVPVAGVAAGMIDLIARWSEVGARVRDIAKAGRDAIELKCTHLFAPVPRPGKIMAIGMNYADHVREMGREPPKDQVWFAKATTAVNGPNDPIQIPKVSDAVDWEAELVVVIGKRGRHIAKDKACDFIFGYACGNDVSARDWQNRTPQWILGKSFDTHAPFGPWITTPDEVGDPHELGIRCIVNGETRQSSNTSNLVFNVWDQLAHLSQVMTLEPGDLIFTGTPGGVGMGMKPPVFLKPGDQVRVEIDKLGALDAVCEAER
jgi:2-keto-4-pentenoate hydratase/2-oxohepta-3-ene-1,7-dioic acid hydratase in catechol pathway